MAIEALRALERTCLRSPCDLDELCSTLLAALDAHALVVAEGGSLRRTRYQHDLPRSFIRAHKRHETQDPGVAFVSRAPRGAWFVASRSRHRVRIPRALEAAFVAAGLCDVALARFETRGGIPLTLGVYRRDVAFDLESLSLLRLVYGPLAQALGGASNAPTEGESLTVRARVDTLRGDVDWSREAQGRRASADLRRAEHAVLHAISRMALGEPTLGQVSTGGVSVVLESWDEGVACVRVAFAPGSDRSLEHSRSLDVLSPRQAEVALLAARGATVQEIARERGLGFETVRTHLRAIYARLDVTSRVELLATLSDDLGR